MTMFEDPNREAVGLAPIWTGAGATRKTKTAKTEEPTELDQPPKSSSKPKS